MLIKFVILLLAAAVSSMPALASFWGPEAQAVLDSLSDTQYETLRQWHKKFLRKCASHYEPPCEELPGNDVYVGKHVDWQNPNDHYNTILLNSI